MSKSKCYAAQTGDVIKSGNLSEKDLESARSRLVESVNEIKKSPEC